MPSSFNFGRRPRSVLFAALVGALVCLLAGGAIVRAQNLSDDAPVLISEKDSTRALATNAGGRGGRSFTGNVFAPSAKTRVTLFLTNLVGLLKKEGATAFRADVEDFAHRRFPLKVVNFEPTLERPWVYALTVELHGAMQDLDLGDVLVRVTWRGMSSNRVRLAIGYAGGDLKDDAGAIPTPLLDKEPMKRANGESQNLVGIPYTGDRVRLIEQATFGQNPILEANLRRTPLTVWINEQMQQKFDSKGNPRFSTVPYPNVIPMPTDSINGCAPGNAACLLNNYSMYLLQNWFFKEALYNEDQQLRRRVSWGLSQIFVVSGRETAQSGRMLPYLKILDRNAFGNYKTLLTEITLNPAMGNYLDMIRSTKNNPNENYAREILQLFSVGLDRLSEDGTPILDNQGNRIPTYDQAKVNEFTKVFTGWTTCNQGCPNSQVGGIVNYRDPLIAVSANHDSTAKILFDYPGANSVLPAGQTAEQDLTDAINNIFNHPNVPPFVSKLLIQQLVTSNPTPAYVGRISAVFKNNGRGERGDLKAVIRAILLDPEARGNVKTDPDYGHLREPVLIMTNLLRPFEPKSIARTEESDGVINGVTALIDQDVFNSPTVFNYYQFDYVLPNTNLSAPEFSILTTGTALKRQNLVNQMVFGSGITVGGAQNVPIGTSISLARLEPLSQSDSSGTQLVNQIDKEMLHGSMSSAMRNSLLTAIQAVASTNHEKRVKTAVYLAATASQFQVQR